MGTGAVCVRRPGHLELRTGLGVLTASSSARRQLCEAEPSLCSVQGLATIGDATWEACRSLFLLS